MLLLKFSKLPKQLKKTAVNLIAVFILTTFDNYNISICQNKKKESTPASSKKTKTVIIIAASIYWITNIPKPILKLETKSTSNPSLPIPAIKATTNTQRNPDISSWPTKKNNA